jgi:bifunctional DNA-binding transcriptional regulator/antitoxin component of YhaV-PrlF toxin-antitoxin module
MMAEPKFIGKVKLTKQGQITLPQEARNDLKICLESELYWYEIDDCLVLVKELVNQKELAKNLTNKKKRK